MQRKKGTFGHCKVYKTWTDKSNEGKRREINIDTVGLGRTKTEIFTTLHHEMVHLYNIEHEVQDTSRGGSYHNKKFRDEAERPMTSYAQVSVTVE